MFHRDVPPELVGVSVKELVKQMGESRVNGNGDTPPDTPPRRTSRSSSPRGALSRPRASRSASPLGEKTSHSSSPVPIPGRLLQRIPSISIEEPPVFHRYLAI